MGCCGSQPAAVASSNAGTGKNNNNNNAGGGGGGGGGGGAQAPPPNNNNNNGGGGGAGGGGENAKGGGGKGNATTSSNNPSSTVEGTPPAKDTGRSGGGAQSIPAQPVPTHTETTPVPPPQPSNASGTNNNTGNNTTTNSNVTPTQQQQQQNTTTEEEQRKQQQQQLQEEKEKEDKQKQEALLVQQQQQQLAERRRIYGQSFVAKVVTSSQDGIHLGTKYSLQYLRSYLSRMISTQKCNIAIQKEIDELCKCSTISALLRNNGNNNNANVENHTNNSNNNNATTSQTTSQQDAIRNHILSQISAKFPQAASAAAIQHHEQYLQAKLKQAFVFHTNVMTNVMKFVKKIKQKAFQRKYSKYICIQRVGRRYMSNAFGTIAHVRVLHRDFKIQRGKLESKINAVKRWIKLQWYVGVLSLRSTRKRQSSHLLWEHVIRKTLSLHSEAIRLERSRAQAQRRAVEQSRMHEHKEYIAKLKAADIAAKAQWDAMQQMADIRNKLVAMTAKVEDTQQHCPSEETRGDIVVPASHTISKPLIVKKLNTDGATSLAIPGPSDTVWNITDKKASDNVLVPVLILCVTHPALQQLLLDGNALGDTGAQALSRVIRYSPTITTIKARKNYIGDVGGREILYSIPWSKSLEVLELQGNQISAVLLARIQATLEETFE